MKVQVHVARAVVWLAPTAASGGLLALVRTTDKSLSHVSYGAREDAEEVSSTRKRWRMVPVRWSENLRCRCVVALPRPLEIVVFALSGQGATQQITMGAEAKLELSAKDAEAVAEAREVVFKTPLVGWSGEDEGWAEVVVARAEEGKTAEKAGDEGEGTFSVQWTSSEALERHMKRKEEARAETDRTLVERLAVVECAMRETLQCRREAAESLKKKKAARTIEEAYRQLRKRRREERRRIRREREAQEQAKKEAVRAKVVARNEIRKQRLVEQWTRHQSNETPRCEREEKEDVSEKMRLWTLIHESATLRKLEMTLQKLEMERDHQLAELEHGGRGRDDQEDAMLSDGLIRAIQRLHVRK